MAFLLTAALLYIVGIEKSGLGKCPTTLPLSGRSRRQAFLYGASDAPASITVDKPPASLYYGALGASAGPQSIRGFASPGTAQVTSVALVYLTVRRASHPSTALLAGAVMATTPVAALMFRYNNPDALLTALFWPGRLCHGTGCGARSA